VVAGQLLAKLPHTAVEVVVAVLFLGGAAYLLFVPEKVEEELGEDEVRKAGRRRNVALTAFLVILVGEFGDLTQLLTASFVAKTHQPASVALGAAAGLLAVSAFGAFSGRALLRVLPLAAIRRAGGVILLGFGAYSIYLATA
jgi:putative Ca2+/H+ antiporter (TMEM165/GDT1 family)